MTRTRSIASSVPIAALALFCAAALAAGKTIAADSISQLVPNATTTTTVSSLTFVPTRCYRRSQICCYKYEKCGQVCKPFDCRTIRRCVRRVPITKLCLLYRKVRVCKQRCHAKLCLRHVCTKLRAERRSTKFVVPTKSFILSKTAVVKAE